MIKSKIVIISFMLFCIFACTKDQVMVFECNQDVTYTNDIKTIFATHCNDGQCHNSTHRAANITLDNYFDASFYVQDNGDALRGSVQHLGGYDRMPQGAPKLSEGNIELISCWIQNGAPE